MAEVPTAPAAAVAVPRALAVAAVPRAPAVVAVPTAHPAAAVPNPEVEAPSRVAVVAAVPTRAARQRVPSRARAGRRGIGVSRRSGNGQAQPRGQPGGGERTLERDHNCSSTVSRPAVPRAGPVARPVQVAVRLQDHPEAAVGHNPTARVAGPGASAAGVAAGPTPAPVDRPMRPAVAGPTDPGPVPERRTGRGRRPEWRRGPIRRRPRRRRRRWDCDARLPVSRQPRNAAPVAAVPGHRRESGLVDRRS